MNLKKGAMYVFVANIINLIISLFTGFVLPKLLSIETYSSIKLFQLYITYIGILHLGFSDGMYLQHGGKTINNVNKKEILEELHTFRVFQTIVSILFIIVSIVLRNEMLLFCSLVIIPINIGNYFRSLYQATGEFKRYSRFTNINTLLIFSINIILLLIIKSDNYYTYIIAYIIVYIIYWLLLEKQNKKIFGKYIAKAKIEYLKRNIKLGFFLMIGNFCNVIFTSIDRIFVQNLLGTIKFAFYSFAVSVENLMNVLITPISTVMYNYLCNNREKIKVLKFKRVILIFSTIIITTIFPAKFIIDFWLAKYQEATAVLFLLFSAQYISIIIKCLHINLYKAEKKQNRYFIIMLIVVIVSIILNIVLFNISKSMEMIALATLITTIIWFIIGEVDFKIYRLKVKEYIYMFLILVLFLLCGQIENAIIGLSIYLAISIILMFMFLPSTTIYCIKQIKDFIMHIYKKTTQKRRFKMKTYFITGGAGFIGSSITERLLKEGNKVVTIDNFCDFYNSKIKENNIKDFVSNQNYKIYRDDIRNSEIIKKIFDENEIDVVIHLAAMAGVRPSIENPLLYQEVNCVGTQNILEEMKSHGIKNGVFASSSSVYGNCKEVPFKEDMIVDYAISPYAATKKANEVMAHVYHKLYNMNIIMLRFFTVYGPKQRPDLAINKFTRLMLENKEIPMFGDGTTSRDYTYIDDIVDGVIKSCDYVMNNKNVYEILNIGNSSPISLIEMINTIGKIIGVEPKINKLPMQLGDVDRTFADISKAKKLLGYEPKTLFEDGIKNFVNWYKENKELYM